MWTLLATTLLAVASACEALTIEGGLALDLRYASAASASGACAAAVEASSFWVDAIACLHDRCARDDKHPMRKCGEDDVVTGLLPLVASRAILPDAVVHYLMHGFVWARDVSPSQFQTPCRLFGSSSTDCARATLVQRLRIWCDLNRVLRNQMLSPANKRVGDHHFVYRRKIEPLDVDFESSSAWRDVPDDLKECIDELMT